MLSERQPDDMTVKIGHQDVNKQKTSTNGWSARTSTKKVGIHYVATKIKK